MRALKANEIQCRVKTIKADEKTNKYGCSLLLYKDARCDMKILDETYTPMNWKKEYTQINGNLFCTVSVWDEKKNQWISKQDVGVESYTEKEKGQASDSFKRACFNWGIGIELYTAPFIWINLTKDEVYQKKDKYYVKSNVKFIVYHINTENNQIMELGIRDQNGKDRFKVKRG